jgi:hypothetical protein
MLMTATKISTPKYEKPERFAKGPISALHVAARYCGVLDVRLVPRVLCALTLALCAIALPELKETDFGVVRSMSLLRRTDVRLALRVLCALTLALWLNRSAGIG